MIAEREIYRLAYGKIDRLSWQVENRQSRVDKMILPIAELIEWLIARGGIELINLGKLKEIKDLRKVWPHEAIDFRRG